MAANSYYNEPSAVPPPLKLSTGNEMAELPHHSHISPQEPQGYHTQYAQYPIPSSPSQQPQPDLPSTAYAPSQPDEESKPQKTSDRLSRRNRGRYEKWKRYLRLLQTVAAAVSTIINVIIFGIMLYVNISYYTTRGDSAGGSSFWPEPHTKVWPSLMMLVTAVITLIFTVGTLIAYCINFKRADASWKITLMKYVVHIGVWIVVSTLYKQEKGNNDLWGWSCSSEADAVQKASDGKIDFSTLCSVQANSWQSSIAEFAVKIVIGIAHFWLHRKVVGEKQHFADTAGDATQGLLQNIFS